MYAKYMSFPVAALISINSFALPSGLPNAKATPGATNSNVTQENIGDTICVPGYSAKIRPPVSYTNKLKKLQLSTPPYKSSLPLSAFEEDHLIALSVGGHPKDPKNLFPQHWTIANGAKTKDKLETKLHSLVCKRLIPLKEAQLALSKNWIESYKKYISMKESHIQ